MNKKYVKEVYDDCIVDIDGDKYYYKDNYNYKVITIIGNVYYYNEFGHFHRLDGPAVEWVDGDKDYYISGDYYSYEDWLEKAK